MLICRKDKPLLNAWTDVQKVMLLDTHCVLYPLCSVSALESSENSAVLRRLSPIMSLSFTQYATPANFVAFSASYFSSVTFERVADLVYPKIAAPNSVISWWYTENVPTNAAGTIITPSDTVPHATDLLPILHDMESAFDHGMRSVVMTIKSAEGESQNDYEFHFAKVSQLPIIIVPH